MKRIVITNQHVDNRGDEAAAIGVRPLGADRLFGKAVSTLTAYAATQGSQTRLCR